MTAQEAKKFEEELQQEAQTTEQENLALFGRKNIDAIQSVQEDLKSLDGSEHYKNNPPLEIPTFKS